MRLTVGFSACSAILSVNSSPCTSVCCPLAVDAQARTSRAPPTSARSSPVCPSAFPWPEKVHPTGEGTSAVARPFSIVIVQPDRDPACDRSFLGDVHTRKETIEA